MADSSALLLRKQFKDLQKNPVPGFSCSLVDDNIYEWQVCIIGPPDTPYENGMFNAIVSFPKDYPMMPPKMRFTSEMWHPNVYADGTVCISILHAPNAEDWQTGDTAEERWKPVHTVESIIMSVISMLAGPNDESPANVDSAKQWREDPRGFRRKVRRLVERSLEQ